MSLPENFPRLNSRPNFKPNFSAKPQLPGRILTLCLLTLGCTFALHSAPADADDLYYTYSSHTADGLRSYTAAPGDTFLILSRRTAYPADLLAAINDLSPGYCCHGGETLLLPISARPALASRSSYAPSDYRTATPTTTPVWQPPLSGIVTSAFASNRSTSRHHGTDIAAESGTPIAAVHSGTVIEAGWKNSVYGYAVLLDHGNGWQTLSAHCSQVLVTPGQKVNQGDTIALVGSTGNSTGPHLHLELKKDGVFLDPALFF